MAQMDERAAITSTVAEIREAKVRIEYQVEQLQKQLQDKTDLLRFWEARMAQLSDGETAGVHRRLRKGEPRRMVTQAYRSRGNPKNGLTVAEVSVASGLGWSTARSTLKRNTDVFEERNDGRFVVRPEVNLDEVA